eukprot:COSAG01_NODE_70775_length_257_cov_2.272152_1_plen_53_part_10
MGMDADPSALSGVYTLLHVVGFHYKRRRRRGHRSASHRTTYTYSTVQWQAAAA